jgi:SAM-dependent methyltransferase
MTKNWNLSAHEWCTATAREFFLMDQSVRERWLGRDPATRSLITVLAPEMKRRMEAARAIANGSTARALGTAGQHTIAHDVAALLLPNIDSRLRLIDIGSCKNFFGERYPELFETVALDLCPADPSVLECDILDLDIVARAPQDDNVDTQTMGNEDSRASRGAGRLKWLAQDSFDVAVISQVLSFIPSASARALVLEKTRQLLRGGETGILLVVEPVRVLRHAGAQLIAAIEERGFRHIPGLRYERRGEAGVGLAFATIAVNADMEEAWARACETKPVHLPAHPGYTLETETTLCSR